VRIVNEARSSAGHRGWASSFGWLTAASVGAVLAINLAGIGGIAVARRAMADEAERLLRLETASRARQIESLLASTRGDLAFLTGSPTFFGLETALGSRDPREVRWRRLEAEGAFLLFLRGHPEVAHLLARSDGGTALVEAGRRGGVPVLWVTERPPAGRQAPPDPPGRSGLDVVAHRITGLFAFTSGVRKVSGAVTLEATVDAGTLLGTGSPLEDPGRACVLLDGAGQALALTQGSGAGGTATAKPAGSGERAAWEGKAPGAITAEAPVKTEGWSAPSPWLLRCARRSGPVVPLIAPFADRYRMILVLNVAVMSLTLLLGVLAIQQARRRQVLEARAREETRVRELERQLFHTERLGTVGRLAAGMAHEINNPLEGMSNYLGLAREDLERGDAASAKRRLAGVQEGLQRAVGIVRQVLAHADPATAPKVVLDLNAVLLQAAEFVRSRPEFRDIRFDLNLQDGKLEVRGVQALLGQVFLNLILNGCEAQPQGGELRLSTRREGGRVVATIADRGPGVPAEDSARIFEPFFSTKQSTGLGLSICYSIVAQHGGDLSVENREGGGAIFKMRFPTAEMVNA
jgi:signal transduction histidine kinase